MRTQSIAYVAANGPASHCDSVCTAAIGCPSSRAAPCLLQRPTCMQRQRQACPAGVGAVGASLAQRFQEQSRTLWGALRTRSILLPALFVFLWQVCTRRAISLPDCRRPRAPPCIHPWQLSSLHCHNVGGHTLNAVDTPTKHGHGSNPAQAL